MSDGQVHSRFGGSKAGRFINCAGSTVLEAIAPAGMTTEYAEEGTLAHDFGGWCLNQRIRDAYKHIGDDIDERCGKPARGRLVTREMAEAVQFYLDAVWDECDRHPGAILLVEHPFTMPSEHAPGQSYGRADAVVYHPKVGRLVVFDYKHGIGYGVGVRDNAQDKFYATGQALAHKDWWLAEVVCVIVQPRDWRNNYSDSEGEVREWIMPPWQVLDFHSDIEAAIARCLQAEATWIGPGREDWDSTFLKAGSWCDWCPAAGGICPARRAQVDDPLFAALGITLNDIIELGVHALPDPKTLKPEKIGLLLQALELAKDYHKQVFNFANGLANANIPVQGFKLADKQSRAKWMDADEEIATYLEMMYGVPVDDTLQVGIVTITEAERLLKQQFPGDKDGFAKAKDDLRLRFTIKDSSGLTLVPESNRREGRDMAQIATAGLQGL